MRIIVTGGFGFIGSNLIRNLLKNDNYQILNIDSLTYSSMPEALDDISKNYQHRKIDICNYDLLKKTYMEFKPTVVMHLAAESHVDNSIKTSRPFINSNIVGTYNLLDVSNKYINEDNALKFLHVSTDEVFGSLDINDKPFDENSKYSPNSPYSASKASSDLLVNAWIKTYKFPAIITHCSNNYGPWQFPEKFIPVIISKCLTKDKIPIYGNGENVRDWIYVDDHTSALIEIIKHSETPQSYNIGSNNEVKNIDLVNKICEIFNQKDESDFNYKKLINFVEDRPGHDYRYSINSKKFISHFDFNFKTDLYHGINSTVDWYINNSNWLFNKIKDINN